MSNRGFNTNIRGVDHYTQLDVDVATSELSRYCDVETLAPELEVPISSLVRRIHLDRSAKGIELHDEQALSLAAQGFISYRTSKDFRLGDLSLDLDPEIDGKPQLYKHLSAPQVHFVWLRPGSFLTNNGEYTAGCFWYQPDPAMTNWYKGQIEPSIFVETGYLGWLHFFKSKALAIESLTELKRAVTVLATSIPEDDEPDWVRQANAEEAAADEAERSPRRSRTPDF